MLEIILEFRKGILFVRLIGDLNRDTCGQLKSEVTNIMFKNGIWHVSFNLMQLKSIDMKGINQLLYHYEICKNHDGNCYICNMINEQLYSRLKKKHIFNYITKMDNELAVLYDNTRLEELV